MNSHNDMKTTIPLLLTLLFMCILISPKAEAQCTPSDPYHANIGDCADCPVAQLFNGNSSYGCQALSNVLTVACALKPVSFRYKKEIDASRIPQFGLIAEDVADSDPDLVRRDDDGKPYSVRYDAVNAMLLNEFIKEHRTVQELKKEVATLITTVKEQAAQIRNVSAQLAAGPQVIADNR